MLNHMVRGYPNANMLQVKEILDRFVGHVAEYFLSRQNRYFLDVALESITLDKIIDATLTAQLVSHHVISEGFLITVLKTAGEYDLGVYNFSRHPDDAGYYNMEARISIEPPITKYSLRRPSVFFEEEDRFYIPLIGERRVELITHS